MPENANKAVDAFKTNLNCAQAVFTTYCEDFGINVKTARRVASCFGAGMFEGETCGAVTGALMLIGAKYGDFDKHDYDKKQFLESRVKMFKSSFVKKYGTLKCKELINFDLGTEEGKILAKENNVFSEICTGFIKTSSEIIEEILNYEKDLRYWRNGI